MNKKKRLYIILNGRARQIRNRGTGAVKERIIRVFRETDETIDPEFVKTEGPMHAAELAQKAEEHGYYAVCAAGGDGTINETVNGLAGSSCPLGIIPLGSGNVFAQELELYNLERACNVIAKGSPRSVDTGVCNGRRFIWMAGIGLDAAVAESVDAGLKKRFGPLAFAVSAIPRLIKRNKSDLQIMLNGKEIKERSLNVIVGNALSFDQTGDRNEIVNNMTDGRMDLCIIKGMSLEGLFKMFSDYLVRNRRNYYRRAKSFDTEIGTFKKLKLDCDPPLPYHLDGEVAGKTPIEMEIHPRSVNLILP